MSCEGNEASIAKSPVLLNPNKLSLRTMPEGECVCVHSESECVYARVCVCAFRECVSVCQSVCVCIQRVSVCVCVHSESECVYARG